MTPQQKLRTRAFRPSPPRVARRRSGSLLCLKAAAVSVPGVFAQSPAPLPPALASAGAPLVLLGVSVIDVRTGRHLPERTVVIVGTRIHAMGRTGRVRVPRGARIIDARGKYLIPGLWDMHVHTQEHADLAYPLFIANGVTGVRDAGSRAPLATLTRWKREIAEGTRVGPRLIVSGPLINSPAGGRTGADTVNVSQGSTVNNRHSIYVPLAAARRVVDSLKAAGADMLKIYGPTRKTRLALIAEAKRLGMRFGGHAGDEMLGPEFADSGATLIDHFASFGSQICGENAAERAPLATFDGPSCVAGVRKLRRHHTWITSTGGYTKPLNLELQAVRARRYQPEPESYADMMKWLSVHPVFKGDTSRLDSVTAAQQPTSSAAWEALLTVNNRMVFASDQGRPIADSLRRYRTHLPIIVGTDAAFFPPYWGGPLPGFAVHEVLFELSPRRRFPPMVAAHMQPTVLAARQTATLNPALAFQATDSLGPVETGKLADLVLLDADPLQDIWNTTTIRAVVANGRYYDRAALDELLRAAERAAAAYRASPSIHP